MAKAKIEDIRNLVLCGHGSAGKTTLVDKMLVKTGAVNAQPSVDDGTSICDFDEEEKHHKYSIEATLVHFEHGGKHFNVIDTPGYPDFIGQTIGAMRGRRHGGDRDQRPGGHRGQHAARVRRGGQGRPGPDDRDQQDGRREHRLPGPGRQRSRSCGAPRCVLLNVPIGHGAEFQGRGQHAAACPTTPPGRWSIPPRSTTPLIESIIEVDEGGDGAVLRRHAAHRRRALAADRPRGGRRDV